MILNKYLYKEYRCSRNAPLNCDQPQQTLQQVPGAKFCLECGFPVTLPDKAEVRGHRGTYQVISSLGSRGMGRLYLAVQLNDNQPVVIKEYLLPSRCFNLEETRQRKEAFLRVAGVTPADGRIQDFRLINPWEAIADEQGERCYLISKGNLEASQTLSRYLVEKGAMSAPQVREVLNQALQTLQFLHTQKLRLPSGQVRSGLAHGNLSLDSLLLLENDQQFYIYLCDLAAWERLFDPPAAQPSNPVPEQDLVALGRVAFYLWVGRAADHTAHQPLDPRDDRQWPNSDDHLKQFLYRLLGLDTTSFDSAEAARQALLQLPKLDQVNNSVELVVPPQPKPKIRAPLLILGVISLLLLGGGWYLLRPNPATTQATEFEPFERLLHNFSDVNGVPPGDFTYTGEKDGTWTSILRLKPESESNLDELLTKPKPSVNAQFSYRPESSTDVQTDSKPLEAVRTSKVDFAITSLVDNLTDDLDSKIVAYDGLLVFVPFSKKDQNLPKALKGQISLEQLRQIYTGEITNWKQLGGSDLTVKLYAPTEPEAVRLFQKRVLKDDPQQIALFQAKVTQQPTEKTQQQIISEFNEGQAGGIGFGILSETWDQCVGYPLALVDGNKTARQALFRLNGQPINFLDDLCDKNNRLNVQTFVTGSYPLGYPLVVVYLKDNSRLPAGPKFAELLTTRQGQRLLRKVGLIPLQPVPEN